MERFASPQDPQQAMGRKFEDIVSVEGMIEACRQKGGTVWAYGRVSTDAQELERQNAVFLSLGIDEAHIMNETKSGKDFERPVFQELMGKIRANDLIVFRSVDRFGRSLLENEKLCNEILFVRKVMIAFTDMPILNRSSEQSSIGYMISSIMYIFQSYFAETERKAILQRTAEGRKLAMKKGIIFGRKPKAIPMAFWKMKDEILEGKMTYRMAREALEINHRTLKKWIRIARRHRMEEELERGMLTIEQLMDLVLRIHKTGNVPMQEGHCMPYRMQQERASLLITKMREMEDKISLVFSSRRKEDPAVEAEGELARANRQRKERELDAEIQKMEEKVADLSAEANVFFIAVNSGIIAFCDLRYEDSPARREIPRFVAQDSIPS